MSGMRFPDDCVPSVSDDYVHVDDSLGCQTRQSQAALPIQYSLSPKATSVDDDLQSPVALV